MYLAWIVWGLGAALYLMGFFQRVAPAVITSELMREFEINAAALGNLSAFYYYSYVAMQIPTGILSDTLGPRRLLAAGALGAAVGTLMFAVAHSFALAGMGRCLIGASVAVAFVGMLKLANSWFPPHYFAMVSGVALLCGIIGGVSAGTPLRLLVNAFGWRQVIFVSALITFLIAAAIWLIVLLLTGGFFSGCVIISFAFAKESVAFHLMGTVSGVINTGMMLGVTVLQPIIGWMLDHFWNGDTLEGIRVYNIWAYQAGFSLMIAWAILGFILLYFTRETFCRQLQ
jgi:MFS family permease